MIVLCFVQSGQTALYCAASGGYVKIVQMLINYGATVDIRDEVCECVINECSFFIKPAGGDLVCESISVIVS